MSTPAESTPRKRELKWPPENTSDLVAFFLEKEESEKGLDDGDRIFTGMADLANAFVRTLREIANTPDEIIIADGNSSAVLRYMPEGAGNGVGEAGMALISGAYAITGARMVDAKEAPKRNRYHVIYEGSVMVGTQAKPRVVPIAFKEEYITDDKGNCVSMDWTIRTDQPQRELVEIRHRQKLPSVNGDDELNRLEMQAAVQKIVAYHGETEGPEYRQAA